MLRVKSNLQKINEQFLAKEILLYTAIKGNGVMVSNHLTILQKIKNEITLENGNTIDFIKMQSTFISFLKCQQLFKPMNCVTFCRESITHQMD